MRDRRGTLGTCTAVVEGKGREDQDRLLQGLERSAQEESWCPEDSPSWPNTPDGVAGRDGARSMEVGLLLPICGRVPQCWKGSTGRSSASASAPCEADGLSQGPQSAPLGLRLVVFVQRDWPGLGAAHNCRGQCCSREPYVLVRPGFAHPGDPLRVCPEGPGSAPELPCLSSLPLPEKLRTSPGGLLRDETGSEQLDTQKPTLSEQTTEYRDMVSTINCTSYGLQITVGLLALTFEISKSDRPQLRYKQNNKNSSLILSVLE